MRRRPPPTVGFGGGADSVRLDGMETQLRALAAQIQQLTDQVRALGGQPRRSDAGPLPGLPATDTAVAGVPGAPDAGRFGSTTVTAGSGGDSIGGLIESDPAAAGGATPPAGAATDAPGADGPAGTDMAALPPAFGAATAPNAADAGNAKQLYETAYGYLMQRDYSAAQGAFEDFLTRYPQDSLAGNAQYWLGEAHFVRGEYKAAAGSFLKGYQNYAGNARAADSLLKLAMSLDRLGQKDAACSSFGELVDPVPQRARERENARQVGAPENWLHLISARLPRAAPRPETPPSRSATTSLQRFSRRSHPSPQPSLPYPAVPTASR